MHQNKTKKVSKEEDEEGKGQSKGKEENRF
jgi:hypothetical protein